MNAPPFKTKNIEIMVPISTGTTAIALTTGRPVFVVGRNGTGKSALIHYIVTQINRDPDLSITYIPGSRPSYFDSDSLSMTANVRQQFEQNSRGWDSSPDTRIRPINGTSKNERAIFDLQAAEIQYKVDAADDVARNGALSKAIEWLQSNASPLNRVNRLLKQANLPVQVIIDKGELRARRDGNVYSISKMSDGERIALVIIADVISAKPGSIILIDEPELHMHPSIVVPLITALVAERLDCSMMVCTHELGLPNANPSSSIVLVRGCKWSGASVLSWDVDLVSHAEEIPEGIRIDLLGSRRKILFIEGTDTSLDQPLYALLYPKISLRGRENCSEVRRAVDGLRSVQSTHNAQAYGLVDNDSMDDAFEEKLKGEGVHALPMFSVESLYYSPEVLTAVEARQAGTLGIKTGDLLDNAKDAALASLQTGNIEHLASRVAERNMRDKLLQQMPSRKDMVSNASGNLAVSILSPYPQAVSVLQALIEKRDLDGIISRYPVRESGVLHALAKGLRFADTAAYEQAALARIDADNELKAKLQSKLGDLSRELD